MESQPRGAIYPATAPLVVDRATPRTIGVLNIVFGILLTLLVAGLGLMQAAKAFTSGLVNQLQELSPPPAAGSLRRRSLQDRIDNAESLEERDRLQRQLDALPPDGQRVQVDIAQAMGVSSDPRVIGYYVISVLTGFVLNILLVVSGVRLLGTPPSGLGLARWTCGLKIARLVLVEGFYVLAVVPILARMQEEMIQSITAQSPSGAPAPTNPAGAIGATYAVMYTALGVMFMLIGIIYPIVVLWLLNKPAVKAAFAAPLTAATDWQVPRAI